MPLSLDLPRFIQPGSLVLVAVSGGGDSVYLAHELSTVAKRTGFSIHLAHVNHGRRAGADDAEARFVGDLATKLGVGFSALKLPAAVEGDHSLEERLREGRLSTLLEEARKLKAIAIAFGHTSEDLAETFLLMALRGSGPTGLGSMREEKWQPSAGVHFWRPLLHLTREEIRESLMAGGLRWMEDPTNELPLHRRNRLRAGIIPLLAKEEPAAVSLLARSARLCAEASDLLSALAQEDLSHATIAGDQRLLILRNACLQALSKPRLAIVLRSAWSRVAEARFPLPPPAHWTDDVASRILAARGETSTFEGTAVHVRVDTHHTLIHSSSLDASKAIELLMNATHPAILLPTPQSVICVANSSQRTSLQKSRIVLGDGQGMLDIGIIERTSLPPDQLIATEPASFTAFFDSSSIRRDLVLRAARDDESISMGPAGSKSVAAALQESGIPAELRPRVAVLADDRGILWIPGVRRAVSAYVTERTSLVLKLSWNRTNLEESPRA